MEVNYPYISFLYWNMVMIMNQGYRNRSAVEVYLWMITWPTQSAPSIVLILTEGEGAFLPSFLQKTDLDTQTHTHTYTHTHIHTHIIHTQRQTYSLYIVIIHKRNQKLYRTPRKKNYGTN